MTTVLHSEAPISHDIDDAFPAGWAISISPLEQPESEFDARAFEAVDQRPWLGEQATDALLALVCVGGCGLLTWLGAFSA